MSYNHFTTDQRRILYRMRFLGKTQAEIARCLARHPSSIGRELKRNANSTGQYLADIADMKATARRRAHVHRPCTDDSRLMAYVAERLEQCWSPEQIAGRLKANPPKCLAGKRISHTTVYRWVWGCRERAQHFRPYLRVACKKRRKPYGKPSTRGQIPNRVSIEDRPPVVDGRDRLGDWEGDTVVGKGRSGYVLTNVDRTSRYTVARKLDCPTAQAVDNALYDAMRRMPPDKRKTQTFDNGREFARHETIADRLQLAVYFAHPYSSWERGTNENTNGLLRQYIPKSRDFWTLTADELARYIWQLNNRPRKCLNYRTPAEVFHRRGVALAM